MSDKLTDADVRGAKPPEDAGMRIVWDRGDGAVTGFGVRITKAGAKAFVLTYRAHGVQRTLTIGSFPDWRVKPARDQAAALKRLVDQGRDPMADRHAEREAPTVNDLADHYRKVHLPKKRPGSQLGDELTLKKYIIPKLGNKKVAAVTHSDAAGLHREITAKYRTAGNRVIALLSKMFNLAVKEGWCTANPCKGIERNPETKRGRFLTPAEIGRLMAALDEHPRQASANAVRLLLLTGARRGEVFGARWEQFDLDAGTWTKPAANTKQKKVHRVPLSTGALMVLRQMRADAEARVAVAKQRGRLIPIDQALFPGRNGAEVQQRMDKTWRTVTAQAGLGEFVAKLDARGNPVKDKDGRPVMLWKPNARIHDLRHTHASILASAGLSLPIIGQLLGHTQAQTTARYAHLLDEPLREATERVSAFVREAAKKKPAEVVPLPVKR